MSKEEVGYKKPPKGSQFSKENQPQNRGRKGKTVSEWLREYGEAKEIDFEVIVTKNNGEKKSSKGKVESTTTINQLIATTVIKKAVEGDNKAISTFLDRTEGRPKQTVDFKDITEPLTPEERKKRITELMKKANEPHG